MFRTPGRLGCGCRRTRNCQHGTDALAKLCKKPPLLSGKCQPVRQQGRVTDRLNSEMVFVFDYPYTSDTALTQSATMAVRDSMLQQYVQGPKEGTYMTTEYRLPPESEVINLNDRYTLLTGGLWKTENYFMGGPFMSLTTLSNDNRRVVSVSGFVFAPKFDKREYIREVEAILLSTKFVENEQ